GSGPRGRGFDRWYGFHGGETHQFVPTLYCDNHSVQPPRTPAEGYHLTEDPPDPPRAPSGRGLPPHGGPRRPPHRVLERPAQRRRRAAVLPLLRHRRVSLAAPR